MKDEILKREDLRSVLRPLLHQQQDRILSAESYQALECTQLILEAAHREAEMIRESARQDGLSRGLAQALQVIEQAEAQRVTILQQAQEEVVPLAIASARKIVGEMLATHPERVVSLIEQALSESTCARRLLIRVSPQALSTVDKASEQLCRRLGASAFTIEVDAELLPGDCIIETEAGRIDARLSVQFDRLLCALTGADGADTG